MSKDKNKQITKRPLTALLIAPDELIRESILDGSKKISIRQGCRDYQVGDVLMLCCHIEPWCVMADVTDVKYSKLRDVTQEEYLADGFKDYSHMLEGMRRFYPDLNQESLMTILRWDNVRGKLVDEFDD